MLRAYIIQRSLAFMEAAAERRRASLLSGDIAAYRAAIRQAVAGFYGVQHPSTGDSSRPTLSRPPAQDAPDATGQGVKHPERSTAAVVPCEVEGRVVALPFGAGAAPVAAREVSRFDRAGYRLENLLFESFPGWEVNATVYVPLDYSPPFPAVIIPVGHSGKQFDSYQLPAQYFARAGYLAVTFDPPGQAGEKQTGNDHFTDGVRGYLVGQTSSRYFVGDALRCVDYVISRPDVDARHGVAMTGVSGGGTTTTLATLLDERITVAGPSCCLTPLADLDITQCYAGCPETHMWRRYAEGVDELDLIAAACPTPVLLMAGAYDEVFHIEDTRRLADEAAAFYAAAGAGERFEFFVDDAGHGYTLAQAREFTRFMDRWLRNMSDRALPDPVSLALTLDPVEMLRCAPRQDVNMRTLALACADELAAARARSQAQTDIRTAIKALIRPEPTDTRSSENANLQSSIFNLQSSTVAHAPFQVWTHDWQQVLLAAEPGIELPATLLLPRETGGTRAAAILHFDDAGRNRLLYRHGLLARAAGFLEREGPHAAVLTVDLRGWGDSTPAIYPYEMAGWGGVDRYLAYATAALGDPVLAMRARDGLAALAYLRSRPEIDPARIVVTGCGLGGVVALLVAAADGAIAGLVTRDALVSFHSLLQTAHYSWPADAFLPNALLDCDLPELVAALACPAAILNPRDGAGMLLDNSAVEELNTGQAAATYQTEVNDGHTVTALRSLLA